MELNQVITLADRDFRVIYIDGKYCLTREFCDDVETSNMVVLEEVDGKFIPVKDQKVVTDLVRRLFAKAEKAKRFLKSTKN